MNMEERLQLAQQRRAEGYNCCQSVVLACADLTDMPEDAACAGFCFGAGMNCGSICGALTGGLMCLGASLPRQDVMENRPLAKAAAVELEKRFGEKFGTMLCSEILRDNSKQICGDCVAFSVEQTVDVIKMIKEGEF